MMLADNGSSWYLSGAPNDAWNNDVLVSELGQIKGSDFEAVDVSSLMVDADSGQVGATSPPPPLGSITVTAPNGGEVLTAGIAYKLKWLSARLTGNVKIELSRDGGVTWKTLFASTPNDGKQSWTPAGAKTLHARLRISSVSEPQVTDASNADFRIR